MESLVQPVEMGFHTLTTTTVPTSSHDNIVTAKRRHYGKHVLAFYALRIMWAATRVPTFRNRRMRWPPCGSTRSSTIASSTLARANTNSWRWNMAFSLEPGPDNVIWDAIILGVIVLWCVLAMGVYLR